MGAPDKMYYKVLENQYLPITTDNVSTEGAIEYIRKDALMEWAKETYLSENASAIRKVCFKQLVEKLMSM